MSMILRLVRRSLRALLPKKPWRFSKDGRLRREATAFLSRRHGKKDGYGSSGFAKTHVVKDLAQREANLEDLRQLMSIA